MTYTAKAQTSGKFRRKNAVFIAIASILAMVGLVMMIYSIVKGSWLFAASYFIALILLVTYIIIRINTVYTTYIASDGENLVMKNWSNDFLPYDVGNKIKVLSEFVPARTKITEIPMVEINKVLIGTKNFIKRMAVEDDEFRERIGKYERSKDYYQKRTVSGMDIFYVSLNDNESYYMPVMNFNTKNVRRVLNSILKVNPDVLMQFGGKEYRSFKRADEK